MYAKIVEQKDCLLSTNRHLKLLKELAEGVSVNAAVLYVVCDQLAGPIYGSGDCNCSKADLLFFHEDWARLRCIPNFRFHLI